MKTTNAAPCGVCGGTGKQPCGACNGKGRARGAKGPCGACEGTGKLGIVCGTCNGSGSGSEPVHSASQTVPVRLNVRELKRLDAIAAKMSAGGQPADRTDAIRRAIAQGLAVMEEGVATRRDAKKAPGGGREKVPR
jgi:hypothetical protein